MSFECNCGEIDCCKEIRASDWKNEILQEKYKGYFLIMLVRR